MGDREQNLRRAIQMLTAADIHVRRVSPLYETEPRDLVQQPWFLNLAVEIETRLFPMQLLTRLQKIERELGRRRTISKGPRTIDIDILLYGNLALNGEKLTIPHPRMEERRFVLEPLAEIAPDMRHPVSRATIREMLSATKGQIVRRLGNEIGQP